MTSKPHDVVIVGCGCRFPGNATDMHKLWDLLYDPRCVASEVPALRGFYHENPQYHGHSNVKEGYLLSGEGATRVFDASFFAISPAEARVMDPQVRLLLETVYEALESGGLTINQLKGSDTAVYAAQMVGDYELLMHRDHEGLGKYHATGTSRTMLSNRLSYFFDWHGPSMTIDTACSSSLVALHHAVQQLRLGHSRVAVVAGSNLINDSAGFIAETSLQMLSPEGRSRMWDAKANGYARGEGVAALILKTREAAEADGDNIECIIRETGINQDGKTPGITMPSAAAQSQLIKDCYERAGLDLRNPVDRPQYFEAHGTGTAVGDPIEAEAIDTALFPKDSDALLNPLYVGSIKTIVGHTEATAGIAGVLKALLALKNATIPPNLLFNELNPRIEPFYKSLCIPTSAIPWPKVKKDHPRRASVNSFGFGGTNAHAILESYTQPVQVPVPAAALVNFIPIVFSAATKTSLRRYMEHFRDFLAKHMSCSIRDIAYSMDTRRTRHAVMITISAATTEQLLTDLDKRLHGPQTILEGHVVRGMSEVTPLVKPKILGIFTGQGAQWAQMGHDLFEASHRARSILRQLQDYLDQLPPTDRPSWSMIEELGKDGPSTRIMEAALSQPLCTAIQIVQTDFLRSTGIEFSAVVGHSSGEIAATYAAGLISARDAICIAYYRGLHSNLSCGRNREEGAMLAVGTSFEDALDLLSFAEFEGRACVAAVNSATSVTLSGDKEAILTLKIVFEDEKKFTRLLKVEKAYHSHHMETCSSAYLTSLAALQIKAGSETNVMWTSSVDPDRSENYEDLMNSYWIDNMVKPVLFQQAFDRACDSIGVPDIMIELGPHPALKAPILQNISDRTSLKVPYTGTFHRGLLATESLAKSLGYILSHLGDGSVDLQAYDRFASGFSKPKLLNCLPLYAWDHDTEFWHETRQARATRLRSGSVHELLGHITPDSTNQDVHWRHFLRPSEIPWVQDHRLQEAMVFPATGYIVSVVEAALILCQESPVKTIDLVDLDIISALVFSQDEIGMEIRLSLKNIVKHGEESIDFDFSYHAAVGKDPDPLELKASGHVRILLGEPSNQVLTARLPNPPSLVPVSSESFYEAVSKIGYQYTGQFKALENIERKLGTARGCIPITEPSKLCIHPAALDVAFQSIFLTYASPNDRDRAAMHVPRRIRRVTVNPHSCIREGENKRKLFFDTVHSLELPHTNMICDIDIFSTRNEYALIQIQELEFVPFSAPTPQDDACVFSTIVWDVSEPELRVIVGSEQEIHKHARVAALQNVAESYLQNLKRDVLDTPYTIAGPYEDILNQFKDFPEQLLHQENHEEIHEQWWDLHKDSVDLKLLSLIGANLTSIITNNESASDLATRIMIMEEWYMSGLGIARATASLGEAIRQIAHRYPHMRILEINTGVGSVVETVINKIDSLFASYTIADYSGSVASGRVWPEPFASKVAFKKLKIDQPFEYQEIPKESFDLVVLLWSSSSSQSLQQILSNARHALRAGGYLVILELLPSPEPFATILFSSVPNWLGHSGSSPSPKSESEWDEVLVSTGFDRTSAVINEEVAFMPFSLRISKATNEKVAFIQDPLAQATLMSKTKLIEDLLIIGSTAPETASLAQNFSELIQPYCGSQIALSSLSEYLNLDTSTQKLVVCLADLDIPTFQQLGEVEWEAFKKMTSHAESLIWVTQGRRAENPNANMILGLLHSAVRENPALDYLLLDFEEFPGFKARAIAEAVLRHRAIHEWGGQDNIQFTLESEMVMDHLGRTLIPRLLTNGRMNERYNSNYRQIRRQATPCNVNISLVQVNDEWNIEYKPPHQKQGNERLHIQTSYSVLSSVRANTLDFLFVVLGKDLLSGDTLIVLSSCNEAVIHPLRQLSVRIRRDGQNSPERLLWMVAQHLLVSRILVGVKTRERILVHEADHGLVSIFRRLAANHCIEVTFTTISCESSKSPDQIALHPEIPEKAITRLVRGRFSAFVDLTSMSSSPKAKVIGKRLFDSLPVQCTRLNIESVFSDSSEDPKGYDLASLHRGLERAVDWASALLAKDEGFGLESITLASIASFPQPSKQLRKDSVIQWDKPLKATVNIRPVDTMVTFKNDRTYWLAGLTGGLGLSLCEWMLKLGARYFLLNSRNPTIEEEWLAEMRARGAVVKIVACDMTIKSEVVALHATACATMPPIVGVAQGVMVLHDTPINSMTIEQLSKVTKPKVDGSVYLNELFQEDTLDFFICFSSASSVIGNHGQANYAAANSFMASLCEQRRRRGLAASVIHIGPVFGVGYIARAPEGSTMGGVTMQTGGFAPTSERDFHQLFAEAVLAGSPGSSEPIEIVSGVRLVNSRDESKPVWESWPRMSHFISHSGNAEELQAATSTATVPIKIQLAAAESRKQVRDIIRTAFSRQLSSHFQIAVDHLSQSDFQNLRFDQIGVDSLIAVEIRAWFMKVFDVNLPVLKILNGGTAGELIDNATENVPLQHLPKLQPNSDGITSESIGKPFESTGIEIGIASSYGSSATDVDLAQLLSNPSADGLDIIKSFPVSFTQSRFYPAGLFLEDQVGLNHTAWARIMGDLDPDRLEQAVIALGKQHEILRTAFFDHNGRRMQHILATSRTKLEREVISDEKQITKLAFELQKKHFYRVSRGETLRIILLSRSPTEKFIMIGVHPLVIDATSLQTLLRWLGFHYSHPHSNERVRQFAEVSEQRHAEYASGKLGAELQYWQREFTNPPPPLPILTLSKVKERPELRAYQNTRAVCKIDLKTKSRIAMVCRSRQTTPFQFYLAALRALLLQYTVGGEDVTVAVAEDGRGRDASEMDVIGPLYNLVLVRLLSHNAMSFEDLLRSTREKLYAGLTNSRFPYPKLVEKLDLQRNAKHKPFFQVFADFRSGQRETMPFGSTNQLVMMGFDLNVPYDVYLDTIDQPNGECSHYFFFRKDMINQIEADQIAKSFLHLTRVFAEQPQIILREAYIK